jgi:hypothetical protein
MTKRTRERERFAFAENKRMELGIRVPRNNKCRLFSYSLILLFSGVGAADAAKMCQMSTASMFFASYAYSCDGTNWATSYQNGTAPYNCYDSKDFANGVGLKSGVGSDTYASSPTSSWKVWGSSTSQATPSAEGIHYCADDSWAYRTSQHPAVPGGGSYSGYNGPSGDRHFCMCQVTKIRGVPAVGAWRLRSSGATASGCAADCANYCGSNVVYHAGWRAALLGVQP